MRNSSLSLASVVATLCVAGASDAAPVTIYREVFGNDQASRQVTSFSDWSFHRTAGAADYSNDVGQAFIEGTSLQGKPNNLESINAGTTVSQTNGFSASFFSAGNVGLLWTSEYTIDRSTNDLTSVTAYRADSGTRNARFAVRIGGQWYATTAFTAADIGTYSTFAGQATQKTWDLATTQWQTFSFTPGTSLATSFGAAGNLPSTGNIEAFGFYHTAVSGGFSRIDSIEINASPIPEPAGVALLAGAGAAIGRRRRR